MRSNGPVHKMMLARLLAYEKMGKMKLRGPVFKIIACVALLAGCAMFAPSLKANLDVGAAEPQVVSEAIRVLGAPVGMSKFPIPTEHGEDEIEMLALPGVGGSPIGLYFFGGQFIQMTQVTQGQAPPPVRADYRNIQKRTIGPDSYLIVKRGPDVTIKVINMKRKTKVY